MQINPIVAAMCKHGTRGCEPVAATMYFLLLKVLLAAASRGHDYKGVMNRKLKNILFIHTRYCFRHYRGSYGYNVFVVASKGLMCIICLAAAKVSKIFYIMILMSVFSCISYIDISKLHVPKIWNSRNFVRALVYMLESKLELGTFLIL